MCKLICESLLQNKKEEKLDDLSTELQIKKSLTSDQKLLYEKMTNMKQENVSAIVSGSSVQSITRYWHQFVCFIEMFYVYFIYISC